MILYKLWLAYLLWFFGGFGCLGLHRFYMRKIPSGILWIFTGGLCFVGSLYDLATLGRQVRDANLRDGYLRIEPADGRMGDAPETLEKSVLRCAKENNGALTPAQAALAGRWNLQEVQKELDRLAKNGFCEVRVTKGGSLVYYFPDFDAQQDKSFDQSL